MSQTQLFALHLQSIAGRSTEEIFPLFLSLAEYLLSVQPNLKELLDA